MTTQEKTSLDKKIIKEMVNEEDKEELIIKLQNENNILKFKINKIKSFLK